MNIIESLWTDQPGEYFCLSTKDPINGTWEDHFFTREEIDVLGFARAHRRQNAYFCPHGFSKTRRIKKYAVAPFLLYADLDCIDPRTLNDVEPTVAIRTSPGRYAGFWVTDEPITEHLNRRLTYYIGADKGGWDFTQLLRLPGTFNYKPEYDPPPQVKLLWTDGPTYHVADLDRRLPELPLRKLGRNRHVQSSLLPSQILAKYDVSRRMKHELLHGGQFGTERRHRFHWKAAHELHEAGVPANEAFVVLSETAWNKHTTDQPVWTMIDRIWSK